MQRACDACGDDYEAKRPNSRFCSDTCRKRGQRGARSEPDAPKNTEVESAVRAELESVGRGRSPLGLAALALARRVDDGRDTGAGLAALVRQLGVTLAAATAGVTVEQSPLDAQRDELAERRRRLGA